MVLYRQIIKPRHFMLRIGKLTDYAMLIISRLARSDGSVLSATVLAEAVHLPVPTVSKILKILSEAALVTSVRGSVGGYRLARPGNEITVANIITAMEGDFAVTECCEMTNRCAINSVCTMRENWKKINKVVQSMLSGLTILDMLEPLSLSRLTSDK